MATTQPLDSRDQAVDSWEKETNASIVAASRKKKMNGVAIGVIAVSAIVAVYFLKGRESKSAALPDANLTVAPRKPVPQLKEQSAAVVPAVTPTATPASQQAADPQKAQLEQQREEQARKFLEARRKSAIEPSGVSAQAGPSTAADAQGQAGLGAGTAGDKGAQDTNSRFARSVSGTGVPVSLAYNITDLEYKILQGKVLDGIIVPRSISDLPGTICATIQSDVYAERGRLKLIPWGSRMCGVYNSSLAKGQSRMFSVWNTLRTANPDNTISEVVLDSIGSDQLGTSGIGGLVDTHFAEIFGTSSLISIIGAGASNTGVSTGDQNNSSSQYRQSVQQAAAQTSQSVLAPYINIPPTITAPAGTRIRIFVNRDLDFSKIYKKQADAAKQQDGAVLID
ncbi:Inner membrane protein of type IV secretion of T-DNA complex, TonB-like, VirB10 (plasmid) [Collimonas arenae]|uniref:Inner membrane protein of type IV secretion of T-DNA complex, TonB-like, VirB10 n=1 Tax=Collimonas arenae TaxID=279058 RepID=A0A0A1FHZ1_9BURK|nr:TrbI/VirB10 family protein [Collimonas arenae]AIY44191.1 Inner membrane protein of type IV secretion of T-DNA complex, TonB-like, VirB10 [Collimonas arenae]